MSPLQRLAELYRATRALDTKADVHELLRQHAEEIEKVLASMPEVSPK